MKLLFLLPLAFIVGCSYAPTTPKTETILISPIGTKSKTVIKVEGNLTRIYSIRKGVK